MKITYTTPNGRLTSEVEVATGKSAFEIVAAIQELFEVDACGCCQSKNIRHEVREIKNNKYYKMLCKDCGATLDFGQHRDNKGLFIKWRDKDSHEPLPDGGWYIYEGVANHCAGQ